MLQHTHMYILAKGEGIEIVGSVLVWFGIVFVLRYYLPRNRHAHTHTQTRAHTHTCIW